VQKYGVGARDGGFEDEQIQRAVRLNCCDRALDVIELRLIVKAQADPRVAGVPVAHVRGAGLWLRGCAFRFGSCFHGPDTNAARREDAIPKLMAESRRIERHSRVHLESPVFDAGCRPVSGTLRNKVGRDGTIRTCVILLPRQVGILYPTSRNFGGHGASRTPTSPVQTERAPINTTRPWSR
jgi:hypothetical protein